MLKDNEKQKNEFFRNVVHDLKNPIGNVKQLAEYLIPGTELTTEDKNDFMQLILESADASLGLITKLLDNSAIEHSGDIPINFESFNINEEINKIIKFYTIQTVNKSLTLKFDNSLEKNTVKTDRETLMRIFDNLISNAIKFSPSDKNIWVKLSGDNMFLKIEIKDEGPGFSEEDKKKLFTQFSKLSARPTAGEHSTGLGLSIVKKLVDSLNGTIECISEKGKGANMVVRVPIGR
jgi:signal transduction histidine kinase